ncbi:histone deacetylase family protein [Alcaligenaceae bacterium CGII-47]|nr:histone deacetylase family protein [Alcaligenaceae bacterium CGII-47]
METLYITHPACHLHEMGKEHPECPQRLDAVSDQLLASGIMGFLAHRQARPATADEVQRVHTAQHVAYLRQHAPTQGYFPIDPDTIMNPSTLAAAWVAAGAGLTALDALMANEARTAFCAIRPPGHHARPEQALGFCFFNNLAVTAAYALEHYAFSRVAIIDFDVHHGNGTEEMFMHDERVLMCSIYQYPFFPGLRQERLGPNMQNIPMRAYTDGQAYRQVVSEYWLPALRAFRPELILVSAGFDAHREDEMGQFKLVEADYAWITQRLVEQADASAQGRIISFLEGGYNLSALGRSAVAHIRTLCGI